MSVALVDEIFSFEEHAEQRRSPKISKLASVHRKAVIGDNVEIGPFCCVGPDVKIGAGTVLKNNVTLSGHVTLGRDNVIFPGAVIGAEPQDINYDGAPTLVQLGDRNVIRECVTINRATTKEDHVTSIGNDCFFMGCVHIAHDCKIGNHIKIANATILGGHVHVADQATISGNAGVHHFTRIGELSFVTGVGRVIQDVPPYLLVEGNPSRPRCVNVVALKRNKFSNETIRKVNEAYRLIYRSRLGLESAREILTSKNYICDEINHLLDFIQYQQEGKHGRGREQIRRAA